MIDAKQCATWSAFADRAIPDASGSADMRGWRQLSQPACPDWSEIPNQGGKNVQPPAPMRIRLRDIQACTEDPLQAADALDSKYDGEERL